MNKHYTFQEYIENFSSIQDSYDYYFEQQKEIDRLNEENKKFNKWIETLNKENHRLNNIINELEKWVDEYPSEDVWYEHITNKLKELKGE